MSPRSCATFFLSMSSFSPTAIFAQSAATPQSETVAESKSSDPACERLASKAGFYKRRRCTIASAETHSKL
jgi:hypothetical protein